MCCFWKHAPPAISSLLYPSALVASQRETDCRLVPQGPEVGDFFYWILNKYRRNLNRILWLSNSFPLILPLFFLLLHLNFFFNLYLRPIVSKDSPLLQWRSHLTWWSKKVSEKEILMEGLGLKMAVLGITVVCLQSAALIWLIWKYQFYLRYDLLKLLTWEIEHWDSVANQVVDSECRSWTQIPQPFKEFYYSYRRSWSSP